MSIFFEFMFYKHQINVPNKPKINIVMFYMCCIGLDFVENKMNAKV